jgi:hypothetical protein
MYPTGLRKNIAANSFKQPFRIISYWCFKAQRKALYLSSCHNQLTEVLPAGSGELERYDKDN